MKNGKELRFNDFVSRLCRILEERESWRTRELEAHGGPSPAGRRGHEKAYGGAPVDVLLPGGRGSGLLHRGRDHVESEGRHVLKISNQSRGPKGRTVVLTNEG